MLVWLSNRVEIMVKHVIACLLCWSSDPRWITVKPGFYWWGWGGLTSGCPGWFFWLSPTFMLDKWHGGEWMKRDLAKPFYGRVERDSPISGLDFASSIWGYFSFNLYEYYTGLYVDHMVVISLVFLLLLCWLCICFMIVAIYGSHHVLTCKWMKNVFMT